MNIILTLTGCQKRPDAKVLIHTLFFFKYGW